MKRVTQTIERTLLLTWIQRIMMQLILRYKRKGFSVFRSFGSWRYNTKYLHGGITWITDLIVHTNRPLMSSYKHPPPPFPMIYSLLPNCRGGCNSRCRLVELSKSPKGVGCFYKSNYYRVEPNKVK